MGLRYRRNAICADCRVMRTCNQIGDVWACRDCVADRLAEAEALLREASECEGVVSGCYALSAGLRKRIQAAVAKGVRDE